MDPKHRPYLRPSDAREAMTVAIRRGVRLLRRISGRGPHVSRMPPREPLQAVGYVGPGQALPLPAESGATVIAFHRSDFLAPAAWRAVEDATPRVEGSELPRRPELGLYDSRRADVMRAHVELARAHGVGAFCFELEFRDGHLSGTAALEALSSDSDAAFGFCVRVTHGGPPSDESVIALALARYTNDPRYVRVDGEAIVLFRRAGDDEAASPLARGPANDLTGRARAHGASFSGKVFDFRTAARSASVGGARAFPIVSTGRSTEPVQGNRAEVFLHASPRVFGERLASAVRESPIVFVDSWNDWNHGATLEPDTRLGRAYLAATRRALSRARPPELRLAAVIHAFYPELLGDLVAMLAALPHPVARLVVTTVAPREAEARAVLEQAKLAFPHECQVHENRGRDILPFLRVANALADDGVDLVVKLHTKRSRHRTDGDAWRRELSSALLSPESAERILAAFRSDAKLGVVGGEGHLLSTKAFFGSNEETVRYVTRRMGFYDLDPGAVPFPAGSMFHARLSALRPLLDAHLGEWEFEPENGAIDGTMAHAIERCVGAACTGAGFHLASSTAPERPRLFGSAAYAYAASSR